jgi:dTDP-4-amino-4,6-dideoxygalactose transaminase
MYNDSLKSFPLDLPEVKLEVEHSYHQYVVKCRNRDNLLEFLKSKGIQTAIHYPMPVHLQPAYKGRVPVGGDLSHTERICNEILSLPIYPEMTEEQSNLVSSNISLWEGAKRI